MNEIYKTSEPDINSVPKTYNPLVGAVTLIILNIILVFAWYCTTSIPLFPYTRGQLLLFCLIINLPALLSPWFYNLLGVK